MSTLMVRFFPILLFTNLVNPGFAQEADQRPDLFKPFIAQSVTGVDQPGYRETRGNIYVSRGIIYGVQPSRGADDIVREHPEFTNRLWLFDPQSKSMQCVDSFFRYPGTERRYSPIDFSLLFNVDGPRGERADYESGLQRVEVANYGDSAYFIFKSRLDGQTMPWCRLGVLSLTVVPIKEVFVNSSKKVRSSAKQQNVLIPVQVTKWGDVEHPENIRGEHGELCQRLHFTGVIKGRSSEMCVDTCIQSNDEEDGEYSRKIIDLKRLRAAVGSKEMFVDAKQDQVVIQAIQPKEKGACFTYIESIEVLIAERSYDAG